MTAGKMINTLSSSPFVVTLLPMTTISHPNLKDYEKAKTFWDVSVCVFCFPVASKAG